MTVDFIPAGTEPHSAVDQADKLLQLVKDAIEMREVQKKFFNFDRSARIVADAKRREQAWDKQARYVLALLGIEVRERH